MAELQIWTVAEIIERLHLYGACVKLRDNKPELIVPSPVYGAYGRELNRKSVIAELVPQLSARKLEILEYLDPDAKRNAARRARRAALVALNERATRANGRMHWFGIDGKKGHAVAGEGQPPDTATFACVEGDESWTALPRVEPDPQPVLRRKPYRKRKKPPAWNGG